MNRKLRLIYAENRLSYYRERFRLTGSEQDAQQIDAWLKEVEILKEMEENDNAKK